jgi:hypothetical protein
MLICSAFVNTCDPTLILAIPQMLNKAAREAMQLRNLIVIKILLKHEYLSIDGSEIEIRVSVTHYWNHNNTKNLSKKIKKKEKGTCTADGASPLFPFRTFDPATMVYAFLTQALACNTACDHVPCLMGLSLHGEDYCTARARLPVELFRRVITAVFDAVSKTCDTAALWHGHRLGCIDGSDIENGDRHRGRSQSPFSISQSPLGLICSL